MRRKLALLLCVLYLANLFPSLYNVQAEATAGEVAWLSMGEPGTIGHGELISPVLNYRNDDTAVEILVTIESVYSSGLEPVPSNFTGPRTVFVEQGVSIGIHKQLCSISVFSFDPYDDRLPEEGQKP